MQENIPIEEVFENLRCSKEGLTSEAAQERLAIFGYNKLEEKKVVYRFQWLHLGSLGSELTTFASWFCFRRVNF